jgi:hypothetical protein
MYKIWAKHPWEISHVQLVPKATDIPSVSLQRIHFSQLPQRNATPECSPTLSSVLMLIDDFCCVFAMGVSSDQLDKVILLSELMQTVTVLTLLEVVMILFALPR